MEGVRIRLFANNFIKKQNKEIPTLEIDIGVIAVLMAIQNEKVAARILMKEIKMVDFYRRE